MLPTELAAEEQLSLDLISKSGADLDLVETLLSFVPDQHRAKKGVRATIEAAEKQHGFDYVKRNILYTNTNASKNYAGYLSGALAIDYGHDWEIEQQAASRAAEKAQTPTVTLLELTNLAEDIRALQRNSKQTNSPELWQQAEWLKAEYARKREIYDAENTKEEVVTPPETEPEDKPKPRRTREEAPNNEAEIRAAIEDLLGMQNLAKMEDKPLAEMATPQQMEKYRKYRLI
jgi:hypothetical protein